jgi:hypothetical protein
MMKTYNVCIVFKTFLFAIWLYMPIGLNTSSAQTNVQKSQLPFIPLTEFMEKNGITDAENFIYVIDRCQANFLSLLKIFNNTNSPLKNEISSQIEIFSSLLVKVINKNNLKIDRVDNREIKIIETMSKRYDEYWGEISIRGIDIAEDELFQKDNKICSYISAKVAK